MSKNGLTTEERRAEILDVIRDNVRGNVNELAERFSVTTATIRTDLKELESAGLVVRTYGGAVLREHLTGEESYGQRHHQDKKRRIASRALELIEDGDVIALDTGTTSLCLAEAIARSRLQNLRIVSPDFSVMLVLEEREDFELILIGGQVRHGYHFSCGDMATSQLSAFRVDKFFLSPGAVDLKGGLTTPSVRTSHIKAKLMGIANETILISDSTKYGDVCFNRIANLDEVSHIVVDSELDGKFLAGLEELGRDVLFA